jgi:hypothetical protein
MKTPFGMIVETAVNIIVASTPRIFSSSLT